MLDPVLRRVEPHAPAPRPGTGDCPCGGATSCLSKAPGASASTAGCPEMSHEHRILQGENRDSSVDEANSVAGSPRAGTAAEPGCGRPVVSVIGPVSASSRLASENAWSLRFAQVSGAAYSLPAPRRPAASLGGSAPGRGVVSHILRFAVVFPRAALFEDSVRAVDAGRDQGGIGAVRDFRVQAYHVALKSLSGPGPARRAEENERSVAWWRSVSRMRIPEQSDHPIHGKVITDSIPK